MVNMKQGVLCKHCVPYEDSYNIYCKLKKCDVQGYKCDKGHCSDHVFEPTAFVVVGVLVIIQRLNLYSNSSHIGTMGVVIPSSVTVSYSSCKPG